MERLRLGARCPSIDSFPVFIRSNRCALCGGTAYFKARMLSHWMVGDVGMVMSRRCDDCEHAWFEKIETTQEGK